MNIVEVYEEKAVSTQNKGRLIVMLYDGAVKFLKQAIHAIESNDFEEKSRNIGRARDIIFELNTVLDMKTGQEVAQNLRQLYNFANRHLTKANNNNDIQMIREVIDMLEKLNQGWRAVTV
ncbi:MAG: flagellar export chaperone FliS [Planctomycetota bacterium]|jgi:flagellar protein FliS